MKKNNKIIWCIFSVLLAGIVPASNVLAAPAITQITSDDFSEYIIYGDGFGATWGASSISWLGGENGNIEQGSAGLPFSGPSGWSRVNNAWPDPVYVTSQKWSGNQSIRFPKDPGDTYPEPISYDTGGSDSIYFSYWVWFNKDYNQWKAWRWSDRTDVNDGANTVMSSKYLGSNYNSVMCADNNPSNNDCYPGDVRDINMDSSYVEQDWQRISIWFRSNSVPGAEDGVWQGLLYKNGAPFVTTNFTTMEDRAEGITGTKRYLKFQNYFGNCTEGNVCTFGEAYLDDIYVQEGTQARVEFCQNSSWSNRGLCEIQIPNAWTDSSIAFTANKGGLASNSGYLYVIHDDGSVNPDGYPLVIGSNESTAPTCFDGIQNGDETGIDCGGSCSACASLTNFNLADFIGAVTDWLKHTSTPADVNGDGVINSKDVGVMMHSWE